MKRSRNEKIGIAVVLGAVVVATAILVLAYIEFVPRKTVVPNVPSAPSMLHVAHVEIVED